MARKGENIYKRKDGRWEGRYKYGYNMRGKTKYKSIYAKSYSACKEKLLSAKSKQKEAKKSEKTFLTVKELLRNWLESILIRIKKSTSDVYEEIANNHILPVMSKMAVSDITTDFLNRFISEKINNGRIDGRGGLSTKTVINIIGVIKAAFRYGERTYGINNPTDFIVIPKGEMKKTEVLSDGELKKISICCEKKKDYFSSAYELCISTGIRIGELCALQCEDIDFENKTLKIRKTIQRVKNDDIFAKTKTKIIITSPKTPNSIREIPLPNGILKRLKALTAGKREKDFIFSPDGKKSFDVRTIQKRFSNVLKKCGIRKVKFHVLRHTFATRWVNMNMDIKSLSEILGHSNIGITLALYVHSSMENKRRQINRLFGE